MADILEIVRISGQLPGLEEELHGIHPICRYPSETEVCRLTNLVPVGLVELRQHDSGIKCLCQDVSAVPKIDGQNCSTCHNFRLLIT